MRSNLKYCKKSDFNTSQDLENLVQKKKLSQVSQKLHIRKLVLTGEWRLFLFGQDLTDQVRECTIR